MTFLFCEKEDDEEDEEENGSGSTEILKIILFKYLSFEKRQGIWHVITIEWKNCLIFDHTCTSLSLIWMCSRSSFWCTSVRACTKLLYVTYGRKVNGVWQSERILVGYMNLLRDDEILTYVHFSKVNRMEVFFDTHCGKEVDWALILIYCSYLFPSMLFYPNLVQEQ